MPWWKRKKKSVPDNWQQADQFKDRGDRHSARGEHALAIVEYSKALEHSPGHWEARYARAQAFGTLGRWDLAAKDASLLTMIKDDFPDGYLLMVTALMRQAQFEAAVAFADFALMVFPEDARLFVGRGMVRRVTREYELAIQDFGTALELDPEHAAAYCGRGQAYCGRAQYEKGIVDFCRAIELDPELGEARLGRAQAYAKLQQVDLAFAD